MDKYEYKLKTEQMLELMENGAYNRAAEIADTIDWKRVRNAAMLTNVSDIYEKNGDYQKSYEILNIAYHRAEGSRKVLYRLCALALKTGNVDEAIDYYDDFIQVAPKDPNQHILKYKILRARRTPIEQQIEALEEFKKAEYIEEWAYELAKLYQEAGMTAECLEECDDLILWFSEGKYVYKAMELKMQYKPLTPSQQEKYDHRYEKIESETEEIPDLTEYLARQDNQRDEKLDSEEENDRPVLEREVLATPELAEDRDEAEEVESDQDEVRSDEPEETEPSEINETIQKLTQRGIASTMKLQDALKSLLHPEPPVEEVVTEEDMDEEAPELEAAIEEIESVADLELVNEYADRAERKKIFVDKDLEELKAEPLTEENQDGLEEVSEDSQAGLDEYKDKVSVVAVDIDEADLLSEDDVEDLLEDFMEEYEEEFDDDAADNPEEAFEPEDIISDDYAVSYEKEQSLEAAAEIAEEQPLEGAAEIAEEQPLEDVAEIAEELPLEDVAEIAEELPLHDTAEDAEESLADDGGEEAEELLSDDVEELEEELPDISDDIEEVYEEEGIEEAETAKNIKPESKKPDNDQIEGQLSIQDVLMGWGDESAKEVEMEEKKKRAEPILPPDIQRLIDEIEGVLPEESEPEPVHPSREAEDEPHENIGAVTKQFRIDDIEEFLAAQDAYEDDLSEDIGGHENDLEAYPDEEHSYELEEEEYNGDEYAEEYTDEYEDELVEEYSDEYEEEEEYTDEYEEELEEEEYADEYEEELEEEEYADEYEEELEEEEFTDEYEDGMAEEDYTDEYEEEEEYAGEYEDEPIEEEYAEEYDEVNPDDIAAGLEEEFRPNLDHAGGQDDREIPDHEDDNMDILSATTPLSRKETAKLIATGKTAPLPLDEISDALSMSDTGFVVHGRYDLAAQSGIGTRAGLTDEQKKLFSYFVPVRGMSEQLVDVLENDRNCTNREGTSRTGNLLIIGNKGNGKTVLAVDVVKAIQKQRNIRQGKVAIVTGDSLNKKKISDIFDKLYGGALIIEKAGKMNEKTVARMNKAMERDTGEMLIVLEEQRKPLDRLLSSNREFRRKFTCRLEVPIFINDELVTFGQTYAQENGYRIDEMGILALYSRIDNLQREDHAVTVAEVKEVMDEAMEHSQKASAKKLVKRVFGKNTDDADRIILSEKDFNI